MTGAQASLDELTAATAGTALPSWQDGGAESRSKSVPAHGGWAYVGDGLNSGLTSQ